MNLAMILNSRRPQMESNAEWQTHKGEWGAKNKAIESDAEKSHCGSKSSGTVWNGYYIISIIQQILFAGEERVEIV